MRQATLTMSGFEIKRKMTRKTEFLSRMDKLVPWTGVPEDVEFVTKPQIALQQLQHLLDEGAPKLCVLPTRDTESTTTFAGT